MDKFRLELGSKPFYLLSQFESVVPNKLTLDEKTLNKKSSELSQLNLFLHLFPSSHTIDSFMPCETDPPDFCLHMQDGKKIGIEITRCTFQDNSIELAKFNSSYQLFKIIKLKLGEYNLHHLYGVFNVKNENLFNKLIAKKNMRLEIANELCLLLKDNYSKVIAAECIDANLLSNAKILSEFLDEITISDYSSRQSNAEGYFWWASHLRCGEIEGFSEETRLQEIIATKESKIKNIKSPDKFDKLWLVIVAQGLHKHDMLILDTHDIVIDKSEYDRIYVVSSYDGLTLLYSKS